MELYPRWYRKGEANGLGPVARQTRFGSLLSGPVEVESIRTHSTNVTVAHVLRTNAIVLNNNDELKHTLHKFGDYETIGINSKKELIDNYNENPLEGKIKPTEQGKYQVLLPFRENHPKLSDNYTVACKRLDSLVNHLKSRPETLKHYDDVTQEQPKAGVVEIVDEKIIA